MNELSILQLSSTMDQLCNYRKDNIRPISKDDYRRDFIMQGPRIIYNHKTRDSYVTLEINEIKEYTLKNIVHFNERSIRKQDTSNYTSSYYFEF